MALDAVGAPRVAVRIEPLRASLAARLDAIAAVVEAGLDAVASPVQAIVDAIAAVGVRGQGDQQQGQGEPGHRLHRALRVRGVANNRNARPADRLTRDRESFAGLPAMMGRTPGRGVARRWMGSL